MGNTQSIAPTVGHEIKVIFQHGSTETVYELTSKSDKFVKTVNDNGSSINFTVDPTTTLMTSNGTKAGRDGDFKDLRRALGQMIKKLEELAIMEEVEEEKEEKEEKAEVKEETEVKEEKETEVKE